MVLLKVKIGAQIICAAKIRLVKAAKNNGAAKYI